MAARFALSALNCCSTHFIVGKSIRPKLAVVHSCSFMQSEGTGKLRKDNLIMLKNGTQHRI